jgi:GTPase SAR1 family protein
VFKESKDTTIGVSLSARHFKIDKKSIEVQIWDTNGCERSRGLFPAYCYGAHCVAVVFSLVNRNTFESVAEIIRNQWNGASTDRFIVLIGIRCSSSDRVVSREEAEEKASGFNILYFEMDAETGEGVEDGFDRIVREGIRKMPNFFGFPDSKKPPNKEQKASAQLVETPEKKRKGLFGSFGSTKADSETVTKPRPPPSIPIQTPKKERKDPPQSAETPKKERKGLFGSKKADLETESDSDFDLEILP